MIVIAHRGASAYAPENTEAAFDLGIAQGADAIETDLRVTLDGTLVLLHDRLLDRTTDGHGPVDALPWSTVRTLDAGSSKHPRFAGQRIPTFESFLDRYGTVCPLYLEIKAPEAAEPAVAMVRDRNLFDQVIFTSFAFESVARVAELAAVRTCWLIHDWTSEEEARAKSVQLFEISLKADRLDRALVERIRATGLGVRAWGVKDDALMRQAAEAGVDGMTVDFPDRLIRLVRPAPKGE